MSKTFGQLKAGDEVYVINGNIVEIVKVESTEVESTEVESTEVESTEVDIRRYALITIGGIEYHLPVDLLSFYDDMVGDIYCDIDDAIKAIKDICENALRDYERASGALIKLETKKKMI